MADIELNHPVKSIHGKISKSHKGYFYTNSLGHQFYRERDESYHKNRSPKQKWTGQAFAYAHAQMRERFSSTEGKAQMIAAWHAANHVGPNGKIIATAHAWQFAMLQAEWKAANPFSAQ